MVNLGGSSQANVPRRENDGSRQTGTIVVAFGTLNGRPHFEFPRKASKVSRWRLPASHGFAGAPRHRTGQRGSPRIDAVQLGTNFFDLIGQRFGDFGRILFPPIGGSLPRPFFFRRTVPQGTLEFVRRLKSLAWILGQTSRYDGRKSRRHLGRKRGRLFPRVRHDDLQRRFAGEWDFASEQKVHHDTERIDVTARVNGFARSLFWRHVRGRSKDHVLLRDLKIGWLRFDGADESEVEDFDDVVLATQLCNEEVRGLDVSMHESVSVCFAERVTGLLNEMRDAFFRERSVSFDKLLQVDARQELHHVIERAIFGVPVIVDVDGIPMSKLCRRADFAFKSLENARVAGLLLSDDFNRTTAFQQQVLGFINFTHSTGAEQAREPILTKLLRLMSFGSERSNRSNPIRCDGGGNGARKKGDGNRVRETRINKDVDEILGRPTTRHQPLASGRAPWGQSLGAHASSCWE